MKLKKSTFQVSKHLLTLQNKRSQGQKNKRRRKSYYSGKKKKHTIKTQYMVNGEGTILLHKTGHDRGRKYMIMKFSKINIPITPLQVENVFDLGYMGVKNDFPTVKSVCTAI